MRMLEEIRQSDCVQVFLIRIFSYVFVSFRILMLSLTLIGKRGPVRDWMMS